MPRFCSNWPYRFLRETTLHLGLLSQVVYGLWVYPFWVSPSDDQRPTRPPLTPAWALECWLWEDDTNSADAVRELLEGYAAHDIPVRTVLIDSPWSTRYNDFRVDTQRYPEPQQFFGDLQKSGYRVVLWMTCMVNGHSKDTLVRDDRSWFEEAKQKGYLAGEGYELRWWKGRGGFIDYTNPQAMAWWHGLQQQVFDWGIDGWKLDGTDTLFSSRLFNLIPVGYQRTYAGWMTTREYMDHYARDEYRHGLTQNPEFVTLVRALDSPWLHPEGFAPLDAAPVTWVGDRTHTWETDEAERRGGSRDWGLIPGALGTRGFETALRDVLLSARLGYCIVGSDVGGYHGEQPIPPRLYIRWAQFSAFSGLFLNGGHGERRLWKRSPEELRIIRNYAWLHTELVPYLYTHVVECHAGAAPLMRPIPGRYHYLLGDDLLVAPIYRDTLRHTVNLPKGRWRYLFEDGEVFRGPATLKDLEFPLEEYPVYVRDGAILPLNVSRGYTGFGDTNSAGWLTLAIYPCGTNTFTVHHPDSDGSTTIRVVEDQDLRISLSGASVPHLLRIRSPRPPQLVTFAMTPLQQGLDWWFDETDQRLWIKGHTVEPGEYHITCPP